MGLLFLLGSSVGKRRAGFYCGIVLLLLSAGALSFSIWQKSDSVKTDTAIVMSPVSSVKSSPSSGSSKDLFVIHEAHESHDSGRGGHLEKYLTCGWTSGLDPRL